MALDNNGSEVRDISPENAARTLQFLAEKLKSPADLAQAWELIERRINWNGRPQRRNGAGGQAISVR
ncbi:MAG TPA: hypothetical protein VH684_31440 [Xanthobacteraceae bacterium]|jgi:hypothetical protein